jgi:hypothetical protein
MFTIEAEQVRLRVGNVTLDVNSNGFGTATLDGKEFQFSELSFETKAGCPPIIKCKFTPFPELMVKIRQSAV